MKKRTLGPAKVPQKSIYSRISFLYQAAGYLTQRHLSAPNPEVQEHDGDPATKSTDVKSKVPGATAELETTTASAKGTHLQDGTATSRYLLSHVRGVSLKGQARLNSTLKHGICRRCDAFLVAGINSSIHIENKSNGRNKPWADVLVTTCNLCDASRRFPIGATRQCSKTTRQTQESGTVVELAESSA